MCICDEFIKTESNKVMNTMTGDVHVRCTRSVKKIWHDQINKFLKLGYTNGQNNNLSDESS